MEAVLSSLTVVALFSWSDPPATLKPSPAPSSLCRTTTWISSRVCEEEAQVSTGDDASQRVCGREVFDSGSGQTGTCLSFWRRRFSEGWCLGRIHKAHFQ